MQKLILGTTISCLKTFQVEMGLVYKPCINSYNVVYLNKMYLPDTPWIENGPSKETTNSGMASLEIIKPLLFKIRLS